MKRSLSVLFLLFSVFLILSFAHATISDFRSPALNLYEPPSLNRPQIAPLKHNATTAFAFMSDDNRGEQDAQFIHMCDRLGLKGTIAAPYAGKNMGKAGFQKEKHSITICYFEGMM